MKHLTLIITLFVLISCNPKAKTPETVKVEKKEMTAETFEKDYGFDITPFLTDSSSATARARPNKQNISVVVWFTSLVLSKNGTVYTTTLPAQTRHCGFQNLTNMTSPYLCRWYLPTETTKDCDESQLGAGTKRTFATVTYSNDVYISNTLQ